MKILSIRIKNLASLAGEHFIDFESDPLASAGLIAIVGKTGAGKSTILDAMCLALFNKIPRLKDSDGKLTDVDGSELLTNSPLTVLRRGTAHGFAELCFVAQDQKRYLARWEIKRSREKIDGKLQSVQRYLKCLTDGIVVADKTKAVDDSIKKISQLSFEQFTRAVLLAQSEVTAFLKARDNERGELLEYLTNSNIFGKIGQLAYEKTKQIANQRKELENVLGHIEILSDEEFASVTAEFNECNTQFITLENEKKSLEKHQQWFDRKQKLDQEIVHKQQSYDEQLKQQQNAQPDHERLNQLDVFSEIRPIVFQKQQLDQTQQQLQPEIQLKETTFDQLSIQFNAEKQQYTQAETALNKIQVFEQQHHDSLAEVRKCVLARDAIAEDYKKIKHKLTEFTAKQQPLVEQKQHIELLNKQTLQQLSALQDQLKQSVQYTALDHGLNAHIQQLSQFIQHYQRIENQLGDLKQAKAKLIEQQHLFKTNEIQFGQLTDIEKKLADLRLSRDQKSDQFGQLNLIKQNLKQWSELRNDAEQLTKRLGHTHSQCTQLDTDTKQAELNYQSIKNERIQLIEILQKQRLLHAENVAYLRSELQSDEPCMVCGSLEHPYQVDDSAVSKALFELQQQQEKQAEIKEQQAFKTWQSSQLTLTKLNADIEQLKHQILQCNEKSTTLKNDLLQQAKAIHIQIDLEQAQPNIDMQVEQFSLTLQTEIQTLDQEDQKLDRVRRDQMTLNQDIRDLQHQLSNADQLQQQVQHIVQCLNALDAQQWHSQTTVMSQHILSQLKARSAFLLDLEKINQEIDVQNQTLNVLNTHQQHLNQQISETENDLKLISDKGLKNTEIAHQHILKMTSWSDVQNSDVKINDIKINDLKPNEWLTAHDLQRQNLQSNYQQCKQKFEQIRQHYEQQKNSLEQLKSQQLQTQTTLLKLIDQIKVWLGLHPDFSSDQLTVLSEINPSQEQQLRLKIQNNQRLLSEASSALKTMQEQQAEHDLHKPMLGFEDLNQRIDQNLEALKAQQEIREQLKSKLDMHQANLDRQQKFASQIQEIQQQEHRWGKISGLMGDANGKKFRDYAQQYNLDILIEHANQQLTLLSQRYTLKRLDNSLSLAIIDHDMDGEMRSVSSLSGGESFLTALALSLAIANMASGSMKIESLFIDEGFGTLDASSLHMVMNALDQLQSQGRKVVLISHIQEMHERIPVQIQVRPLGAGASSIEVVG